MTIRVTTPAVGANGVMDARERSLGTVVAGRLVLKLLDRIQHGRLSVRFPDGREVVTGQAMSAGDVPAARIDFRHSRALHRMLSGGVLGLARAYIDGEWDSPDLVALITLAVRNELSIGTAGWGHAALRVVARLRHLTRPNTRAGSRRNIARHYDLGNDFYRLWLDQGMTYSSALFGAQEKGLMEAQDAKYRRLAETLDLAPNMHVLEIGCGWGGFAEFLARDYGCRVTAITVSEAQCEYARTRISRAGIGDAVDIRLVDYRDIDGSYDRIASIEMLEAVGGRNWPRFFDCLDRRLAPGGVAALQVINIEDPRFEHYRRSADFIQTYIFPGGMLPSQTALRQAIEDRGFVFDKTLAFGSSYAVTLKRWRARFEAAWPEIAALGFDERFRNLWRFYLAYCEAGFRCGTIDVGHYRLERRRTD